MDRLFGAKKPEPPPPPKKEAPKPVDLGVTQQKVDLSASL
jgi:hypothetical protein